MKTIRRKLRMLLTAIVAALSIVIGYQGIADYLAKPPSHQALVIGEPAPEFELPLLQLERTDDNASPTPSLGGTVKLSSHRDKQLICLFISSFT